MKKYLIIAGLAIVVVSISVLAFFGISNATKSRITCESKGDSNSIKINQKYVIEYDGDKVKNTEISKSYEYSNKTQFEPFKTTVIPGTESNMKAIEGDYVKFSSTTGETSYSTKLEINVEKASSKIISGQNLSTSLKQLKTNLKDQGLTCSN